MNSLCSFKEENKDEHTTCSYMQFLIDITQCSVVTYMCMQSTLLSYMIKTCPL